MDIYRNIPLQIPFNDISAHYHSIKSEIDGAVANVFNAGQFVGGSYVKSFEEKFAAYHNVKHCISTGNGTDSLFAMIKSLGIREGTEVITPAWSWISTSEVITLAKLKPVFVDADPITFNISTDDVKKKITSKTKALLAVHLYGQCCDINALIEICKENKIILLEDCAQAHGAKNNNQLAGTFGKASSFSFYPTKNLGAFGDAGCVLTNDDELAIHIRRFVNHGGITKDEHTMEGINSRMDTLQAAMLSVKLKYLEQWNERRREIAALYHSKLKNIEGLKLPNYNAGNVFHLYVIRCKRRDELKSYLERNGIGTMIHYPSALPFEPAYAQLSFKLADFSVATQLQDEVLSLPCYPELTSERVEYICSVISKFNF